MVVNYIGVDPLLQRTTISGPSAAVSTSATGSDSETNCLIHNVRNKINEATRGFAVSDSDSSSSYDDLIRRLRSGDDEAAREVFDRYAARLLLLSRRGMG